MEDAYLIKGGKQLTGEITLSGAKNVALKVIIGGLMFNSKVIIDNIPRIKDVNELISLVNELGGKARFIAKNQVEIDGRGIKSNRVDLFHGSKIRVSFMFFAPLLLRFNQCYIPNPGGCRIGARPIDRVVEGMRSLGLVIEYDSNTGYYNAQKKRPLQGEYRFSKSTHTGTELLILLAVIGNKRIVLDNAALEPEIDDLIQFLNQGGARITRKGKQIIIDGVSELKQKRPYSIVTDRNEAITYATLGLATKGSIKIGPIPFYLIKAFCDKVIQSGGRYDQMKNDYHVFSWQGMMSSTSIETAPYPGFMTDWQPNWAVLMTQARGMSQITERVFENRFAYVDELRKLGAEIDFVEIKVDRPDNYFFFNFDPTKNYLQAIRIKGPQKLHGGVLTVSDLRAGATLAIGALIADGESVIKGARILERGYEDFIEKVTKVGGIIKKI